MDNIREKRYIKIPNFFSKEELDFLQVYAKKRLPEGDVTDTQSPVALSFFDDPVFNIFHQTKTKLVEEISSLRLIPTYTYWRAYVYGSILETHTDKPTCEISMTANIDSCGTPWPISMDGNEITLNPGEGCLYLGCEVPHGRKPFEGLYSPQVFFHWVDRFVKYEKYKTHPRFWDHPDANEDPYVKEENERKQKN